MYLYIKVDKAFVTVGETLTYTITIGNDENETARDIRLNMYASQELHRLQNTLIMNGNRWLGEIEQGIYIEQLTVGEQKTIVWSSYVESIPAIHSVTNTVDVWYFADNAAEKSMIQSNTVITLVTDPCLDEISGSILFEGNKETIDLDEEIQYTLVIMNKGNTPAFNITIEPLVSDYTTLQIDEKFKEGLYIPELKVNEEYELSYCSVCKEIPPDYVMSHRVQIHYEFRLPNRQVIAKVYETKEYQCIVETATFKKELGGIDTSVSAESATVGDTLTYQLCFMNKGNKKAEKVYYQEAIPKGVSYVPNSLMVNGVLRDEEHFREGILLGDIQPGERIYIMYHFKIDDMIPEKNPIGEVGQLLYTYEKSGMQAEKIENVFKKETYIEAGIVQEETSYIQLTQKVAALQEHISGKLIYVNEGNKALENIKIDMILPEYMVWEGDLLDTRKSIQGGERAEIAFTIKAQAMPEGGEVTLTALLSYSYLLEGKVIKKKIMLKQRDPLMIRMPVFGMNEQGAIKKVDKLIAQLGDILNYTVTLTNTGNVVAEEVVIREIHDESICTIESVIGNKEGLYVGTIGIGEQKKLYYQARIITDDVKSIISPKSEIEYVYELGDEKRRHKEEYEGCKSVIEMATIEPLLKGEKEEAVFDEPMKYHLILKNKGNLPAYDIQVMLPAIEGCNWEQEDKNITKIDVGKSIEKQYTLSIEKFIQQESIKASVTVQYKFKTSEGEEIKKHYVSAVVETPLNGAYIKVRDESVQKLCNKEIATKGDVLTYTIKLKNVGNCVAEDIVLEEEIDKGLKYIPGSIKMNGSEQQQARYLSEANLEVIKPKETCEVSYQAEVIDLPKVETLCSRTHIQYSYRTGVNKEKIYKVKETVESKGVKVVYPKIATEYGSLRQSVSAVIADKGEILDYTIDIMNIGNSHALEPYYQIQLGDALQFVPNTLQINNQLSKESINYIVLPAIEIETICRIAFKAQVINLPKEGYCTVGGTLSYMIQKPDGEVKRMVEENTLLKTNVYTAGPIEEKDFLQQVDKKYGCFGEKIHVLYRITNAGNRAMERIRIGIGDEIGCLKVVEEKYIDRIEVGETKEEILVLDIIGIPKKSNITVQGKVSYYYKQEQQFKQGSKDSEKTMIEIQDTGLKQEGAVLFEADKSYAEIGEVIRYTIKVKNEGNIPAYNMTGKIYKDDSIQLVEDSYRRQYKMEKEEVIQTIYIECIQPGEEVLIRFKGKVVGIPMIGQNEVKLKLTYSYKDRSKVLQMDTVPLKAIICTIRSVDFGEQWGTKLIKEKEVTIGEKISYEMACMNKGNVIAHNTRLKQILPQGIKLIKESVQLNGKERVQWSGPEEIVIGEVKPKEEVRIAFEAYVQELNEERLWKDKSQLIYEVEVVPDIYRKKELVPIEDSFYILSPQLDMKVESEQREVLVGDTILLKLKLTNRGNQPIQQIKLNKLLPESYFKLEKDMTLTLDSVIGCGESLEKELKAKVMGPVEGGDITFNPEISYNFWLRQEKIWRTEKGRGIAWDVHQVKLETEIKSDKDGKKVEIGEIIHYFIYITNRGTLPTKEVKVYYTLPKEMKYMSGSIVTKSKRIGIQQIEDGMNIGTLEPGEQLRIQCKEVVIGYEEKYIGHRVYAKYKYEIKGKKCLYSGMSDQVEHEIRVLSPFTKKIFKRQSFVIPAALPNISRLEAIEIIVTNIGVRNKIEETKEVEIALQVKYDVNYYDTSHKSQRVAYEQLLVERLQYMGNKTLRVNEKSIEVEKKDIRILNVRQIEVGVHFSVEL